MTSLASRLAAAMKTAGLNQPLLAKAASMPGAPVSQQVVQHLLSGRNQTSRFLPAIAKTLDVSLEWLATGRGNVRARRWTEAVLVGKVDAGEVTRDIEPSLLAVSAPVDRIGPNVLKIGGATQLVLEEGWLIFYCAEQKGVSRDCFGRLCAIQIENGPMAVGILKRGSEKGRYHLDIRGGKTYKNVRVSWASAVTEMRQL